jgi:hypothetical protein
VRDTEDKLAWCADGVERENDFVARVAPALKLDAKINPEKETNIYAPDLVVNGVVSDLKSQTTPFYTARRMFRNVKRPQGIDPQYAVSFNRKDYLRYKEHYPNLDVYFWVEWMALEGFGTKVRPLVGIYRVSGIRSSFWPSSQSGRVPTRCVGSLRPRCAHDGRSSMGCVEVSPSRLVLAPPRSKAKEPPEPARIRHIAGEQDGASERPTCCVECLRACVAGTRGRTAREGRHTVPRVVASVPQATCPSVEVEACCALEHGYPTLGGGPCALRCLSLGCRS